jgi:hypothetical protein
VGVGNPPTDQRPTGTKNAVRTGHAVEPPPTIRPKAKPQPAIGPQPVKHVGHGEGESGPNTRPHQPVETGHRVGLGGKRSYRVTRPAAVAITPEAAPAASTTRTVSRPEPTAPPVSPAKTTKVSLTSKIAKANKSSKAAAAGAAADVEVAGVKATGKTTAAKGGRVKLNLSYVAPLSVAKISFLISIALGVAFVVAVFVLWTAFNDRQVFTQIDQMITDVVGASRPESLDVLKYFELGRIMSGAAVIAVVDVVIITAMSTLMAVVYNIIAALVGGIHVTLKEK